MNQIINNPLGVTQITEKQPRKKSSKLMVLIGGLLAILLIPLMFIKGKKNHTETIIDNDSEMIAEDKKPKRGDKWEDPETGEILHVQKSGGRKKNSDKAEIKKKSAQGENLGAD